MKNNISLLFIYTKKNPMPSMHKDKEEDKSAIENQQNCIY